MCLQANFADIYLRGMRDRSMRSGTELAREIQLPDWSTAGEEGKLVFVVSTTPSLAQFISLFTTGKKSSFDRPNYTLGARGFFFSFGVLYKIPSHSVLTARSSRKKNRTSGTQGTQITDQFKFFTLRFLSRKNVEKKFLLTNKIFFRSLNQIRRLRVARKPA